MVHTYPRTELCGSLAYHYDATTKQRIAETIAQQIPALSLYLPPEQSPSTESPSSGAQRTSTINALELVLPATGCPEKLPTYRSLAHACKPLDEKTCNENRLCTWSRTNQCSAKSGSYVPAPDIDPAVAARLGLAYVDNLEPIHPPDFVKKGNKWVQIATNIHLWSGKIISKTGNLTGQSPSSRSCLYSSPTCLKH